MATISDIINQLNGTIHSHVASATDVEESNVESNMTASHCSRTTSTTMKGFELHTKLPDGSSRPATTSEIATANFQCKVQYMVSMLQTLPDLESKIQYANEQRVNVGNIYYENQQFHEAIDIYLTCLTVITPNTSFASTQPDDTITVVSTATTTTNTTTETQPNIDQIVLYLQLMNNIALCTIRLQNYQKTITICTMAIEYYHNLHNTIHELSSFSTSSSSSSHIRTILQEQQIKLYYKRAKSYRCKGLYTLAQQDIDFIMNSDILKQIMYHNDTIDECDTHESSHIAIESFRKNDTNPNSTTANPTLHQQQLLITIQKEQLLLNRAIQKSTKHAKQQKQAMQHIFNSSDCIDVKRHIRIDDDDDDSHSNNTSCIGHDRSLPSSIKQRTYSTLRAPSTTSSTSTKQTLLSSFPNKDVVSIQSPSNIKRHEYWYDYAFYLQQVLLHIWTLIAGGIYTSITFLFRKKTNVR